MCSPAREYPDPGGATLFRLLGLEDCVARLDEGRVVRLGERRLEQLAVDLAQVTVLHADALDSVDETDVVACEGFADCCLSSLLLRLERLHRCLHRVELDDECLDALVELDGLGGRAHRGGRGGRCHCVFLSVFVGDVVIIQTLVFLCALDENSSSSEPLEELVERERERHRD